MNGIQQISVFQSPGGRYYRYEVEPQRNEYTDVQYLDPTPWIDVQTLFGDLANNFDLQWFAIGISTELWHDLLE